MIELEVLNSNLVLHVRGADKLWALKSRLEIPIAHIAGVRVDSTIAQGWWKGLKMPGTNIPGVITAGTFYQHGKRIFWDVHDPGNTIVFSLRDDRYDELIVEVANPNMAVKLINDAVQGQKG